MREAALTVAQLTRHIKSVIENDLILQDIWVKGELSNVTLHSSGHLYFTLKDSQSQLKGVMWKSSVQRLRFRPKDGQQVLVQGSVSVYEPGGQYQFYGIEMEPQGVGALHLAFEELKRKLAAEGLFEEGLKRPLPKFPRRIGLVTASGAAALRDLVTVSLRRNPGVQLLLAPAIVQGAEAPGSLMRALNAISQIDDIDVIIIGRGGGSLEDLWAFNDEALARAIRACRVPIVSAVGHETDWTIADFVADRRAATPSNAAEMVVPLQSEARRALAIAEERLLSGIHRAMERKRERLVRLSHRPVLLRPDARIQQDRQRLDGITDRLEAVMAKGLDRRQHRLAAAAGRLGALSPLAVLGRGYAIARRTDGTVVKAAGGVAPGERLNLLLHEGSLTVEVKGEVQA
jgi:exodeoxyribonuclease VII large subunit